MQHINSNNSPWLKQLNKNRLSKKLERDTKTDVAIIGAGIAGITTAFYILKHTDKSVVIIEKGKLAHGATGHNAGQITSYFERGLKSISDEFGLELAAKAQRNIEESWELLEEIYRDCGMQIPFSKFEGHAGIKNLSQLLFHLDNNMCRKDAGLELENIKVSNDAPYLTEIDEKYKDLYSLDSKSAIQERIETRSEEYTATLSFKKGCINSALFCEKCVEYMASKYGERFSIFEHTSVQKVVLKEELAIIDTQTCVVETKSVVLCTNGFESINILDKDNFEINKHFHDEIQGVVGYMSGYIENSDKSPTAISYFEESENYSDPYFYLTRRPYEYDDLERTNLISIGGPESMLEEKYSYDRDLEYPEEAEVKLGNFLKKTYINNHLQNVFNWHGLMGYTKNGIRMIGRDPYNKNLLYNLGCNGVGILPSVYGAKRLSDIIIGRNVDPSIFDVKYEKK